MLNPKGDINKINMPSYISNAATKKLIANQLLDINYFISCISFSSFIKKLILKL